MIGIQNLPNSTKSISIFFLSGTRMKGLMKFFHFNYLHFRYISNIHDCENFILPKKNLCLTTTNDEEEKKSNYAFTSYQNSVRKEEEAGKISCVPLKNESKCSLRVSMDVCLIFDGVKNRVAQICLIFNELGIWKNQWNCLFANCTKSFLMSLEIVNEPKSRWGSKIVCRLCHFNLKAFLPIFFDVIYQPFTSTSLSFSKIN